MFHGIKEIDIATTDPRSVPTLAAGPRDVAVLRVPDTLRAPASLVLPRSFHPDLIITLHSIAQKAAEILEREGRGDAPDLDQLQAAVDLAIQNFHGAVTWSAPTEPESYNRLLLLGAMALLTADALARKLDREAR